MYAQAPQVKTYLSQAGARHRPLAVYTPVCELGHLPHTGILSPVLSCGKDSLQDWETHVGG